MTIRVSILSYKTIEVSMKQFFVGLSIILILFGGFTNIHSQITRPSERVRPTGLVQEGNKKAKSWFDKTFRSCRDSTSGKFYYYTKIDILNGYSPRSVKIIEIEDLENPPLQWQDVPEADFRGGLDANAFKTITGKLFRSFLASVGEWSETSNNFTLTLRLIKRQNVDWTLNSERPEYTAPTCDEVQSFYNGSYKTRLRDEGQKRLTNIISVVINYTFPKCFSDGSRYVLIEKKEILPPYINSQFPSLSWYTDIEQRAFHGILQLKPPTGKEIFELKIDKEAVDLFAGISPLINEFPPKRVLRIPIQTNVAEYKTNTWNMTKDSFNEAISISKPQTGNPLTLKSLYYMYYPQASFERWMFQEFQPSDFQKSDKSEVTKDYNIFTESFDEQLMNADSNRDYAKVIYYISKLDNKSDTCYKAKIAFP